MGRAAPGLSAIGNPILSSARHSVSLYLFLSVYTSHTQLNATF